MLDYLPLFDVIHHFASFNALVVGDFLLDAYTVGRVNRISPEAPVQILEIDRQEFRPGGAGNAVLNLVALGGKVTILGRIGQDKEGESLSNMLTKAGVNGEFFFREEGYQTPVKHRFIADNHHLLRTDREKKSSLSVKTEAILLGSLKKIIQSVQIVAISDYGKGFLTDSLIQAVIQTAKVENIPCIVDPKGTNFKKYSGATLLKPNKKESYAAAMLPETVPLEHVVQRLFECVDTQWMLITKGGEGISLFDSISRHQTDFPIRPCEVRDVTGAGDTVLAVLCLAITHGVGLPIAIQLANIAAGIVVEKFGCAQVSLVEISERILAGAAHSSSRET